MGPLQVQTRPIIFRSPDPLHLLASSAIRHPYTGGAHQQPSKEKGSLWSTRIVHAWLWLKETSNWSASTQG
jgi:hypothetical protein